MIQNDVIFKHNISHSVDSIAGRSRTRTAYLEAEAGDTSLTLTLSCDPHHTVIIRQIACSPSSDADLRIEYDSIVVWQHNIGTGFVVFDPMIAPPDDVLSSFDITIVLNNVAEGESLNVTYERIRA